MNQALSIRTSWLFYVCVFCVVFNVCEVDAACCPNGCSGHGACYGDQCECYPNWQSGEKNSENGDCSERTCPYEIAWADGPSQGGRFHAYAECANKGICDRLTGECLCFAGYEGKGCGRMSCPDNCSGHGRCTFTSEIPYGANIGSSVSGDVENAIGTSNGNDAVFHSYDGWDAMRSRVCVCDAGYEGISCEKRTCPKGPDMLGSGTKTHSQLVVLIPPGTGTTASYTATTEFALSFTTLSGQRFTTNPIPLVQGVSDVISADLIHYNLENDVRNALEGLPSRVIDGVSVTLSILGSNEGYEIKIDFTGSNVQGEQNLLEVEWKPCGDGCNPYMAVGIPETALALTSSTANTSGTVPYSYTHVRAVAASPDYEPVQTCGGRGKCDYSKGECKCFSGYYGLHCELQTALI